MKPFVGQGTYQANPVMQRGYRSAPFELTPDYARMRSYEHKTTAFDDCHTQELRDVHAWFRANSADGHSLPVGKVSIGHLKPFLGYASLTEPIGDPITDIRWRLKSEVASRILGTDSKNKSLWSDYVPPDVLREWVSVGRYVCENRTPLMFTGPLIFREGLCLIAESVVIPVVDDTGEITVLLSALSAYEDSAAFAAWPRHRA